MIIDVKRLFSVTKVNSRMNEKPNTTIREYSHTISLVNSLTPHSKLNFTLLNKKVLLSYLFHIKKTCTYNDIIILGNKQL